MALAYCTTCSWRERDDDDGDDPSDLNRSMIDHFAATGHAVERADASEVLEQLTARRPATGTLSLEQRQQK